MIKNCPYCGKEFVKSPQHRKYCSVDCQVKFRRRLDKVKAGDRKSEKIRRDSLSDSIVKKAIYIGSKGKITYDQITSEMITDKKISLLVYRKRQEGKKANSPQCRVYFKKCIVCGSVFTSNKEKRKVCSSECYRLNYNKYMAKFKRDSYKPKPKIKCVCRICGVSFKGNQREKCCSDKCRKKNRQLMKTGSHRERARKFGVKYEHINPFKVFERDGWCCQICGKVTPMKNRGTRYSNAPELDHRIPISKGGSHVYSNVQCACRECNGLKSNNNGDGQLPLFEIKSKTYPRPSTSSRPHFH